MRDLMECTTVGSTADETARHAQVEQWQQNYAFDHSRHPARCAATRELAFSALIAGLSCLGECVTRSTMFLVHLVHTNIHDLLASHVII